MFNVGPSEAVVILIAALLILGPRQLPELARGLGKFLRAFRRQTEEVRTMVEREFYRLDEDPPLAPPREEVAEPLPKLPAPEGVPISSESLQDPEKKGSTEGTSTDTEALTADPRAQTH